MRSRRPSRMALNRQSCWKAFEEVTPTSQRAAFREVAKVYRCGRARPTCRASWWSLAAGPTGEQWENSMHIKTLTTLALAGLLAACGALAAEKGELREETALQNAKVTLPQAIATAEQQTGGRAYEAGVDLKHGEPRIAVETNGPK